MDADKSQVTERLIADANVTRDKLNITVTGKAVVRKIIAGTGVTISETGVDDGTGDVTINVSPSVKKSYVALISQAGTNAPTATVILNEIGEIVWSRVSTGIYRATLTGAFVSGKTAPIDDCMMDQAGNYYTLNRISADVMELKTYAYTNLSALADGVLSSRYVNFEVYN